MSRYAINHTPRPYSTHGILISRVGKDQCVLDVGCNEGYIGRSCDKSNKFYGLDLDEAALVVARKHYMDVALTDLDQTTKLPWDRKFDMIIFGDVLEHLLDPQAVYKALVSNYLKPGGKVVISLPNIANWAIRINLMMGKFDYQDTGILDRTHLHFFTYRSAMKMFENDKMKLCMKTGGSSIFGWLIHSLPFTQGLLAHTIIMELVYASE